MSLDFVVHSTHMVVIANAAWPCYALILKECGATVAYEASIEPRMLSVIYTTTTEGSAPEADWTVEHVMTPWTESVRSPLYDAPWPSDEWDDYED